MVQARPKFPARRRAHGRGISLQRSRGCTGGWPVSIDLQRQVWDDPEPRGSAKTVLVHLAWYVKKDAWDRGGNLLAWPSQNTIASKCCIARSTVEGALKELVELGKIRDTGLRRQRRTVVWELYPSTAPAVTAGWEIADLPDSRACDLPDHRASETDMPGDEASATGGPDDLPDSRHDLPDPSTDLPGDEAGSCPVAGDKREGTEENRRGNRERRRAQARDLDSGPGLSEELAEVEALLGARPNDKLLDGRRQELQRRLGEGEPCL